MLKYLTKINLKFRNYSCGNRSQETLERIQITSEALQTSDITLEVARTLLEQCLNSLSDIREKLDNMNQARNFGQWLFSGEKTANDSKNVF